jgi:peroxiredoxin
MRCLGFIRILLGLAVLTVAQAAPPFEYRPLTTNDTLVPRTLLPLIHAPEVQRELHIQGFALEQLVDFLRQPDADWMRVRSGPRARLDPALDAGEASLAIHLSSAQGSNALHRLRQLELQAQRARALLRPDVAAHLELTAEQSGSLRQLFAGTDLAESKTQPTHGWPLAADIARFESLKKAERPAADKLLQPDQRRRWTALLGDTRDTASYRRIHPLVPELIAPSTWIAGSPVRLAELRGKVVVVHFYAFQCRNCQANFPIYRRWHERLRTRDVAIVGIQSPETEPEKDPVKARDAAREAGFDFPVLFDPRGENWRAWDNQAWPAIYLIDKRGYLRAWWIGELNFANVRGDQFLERLIDQLRAEE